MTIGALRWFECGSSYIAIDRSASVMLEEIGVADANTEAVADLVDMVLLDELDTLLCCLDDWVGQALDWKPLKTAPAIENSKNPPSAQILPLHELSDYPQLTARLSSLENESQTLWLAMNIATLDALPPLPEAWQSLVVFKRYATVVKLQLQQIPLLSEEHSKLGIGAVVLLPRSFASQWQAMLVATEGFSWDIEAPGSVIVDTDQSLMRLLPPTENAERANVDQSGAATLTVELDALFNVNELYTESVWQFQGNMVIALPQAVEGARATVSIDNSTTFPMEPVNDTAVSLQHDEFAEAQKWSGVLMRVGQGYGVLLEAPLV